MFRAHLFSAAQMRWQSLQSAPPANAILGPASRKISVSASFPALMKSRQSITAGVNARWLTSDPARGRQDGPVSAT